MTDQSRQSSQEATYGETTAPSDEPGASSPPILQTAVQRYQLLDEIARGGMGVIWRATDTALRREVAVKVLQDKFALDSGTARRFADEARITAQLQHPTIPPVHDCGSLAGGLPFLAMKLIKGRTLEELLRQRRDPTAERGRFLAVFEQVCQALAYAHAHQVIHRDLKPANVMVGGFGEVQVMDWGLAKVLTKAVVSAPTEGEPGQTVVTLVVGSDSGGLDDSHTQAGSILGTLAYMPPEQAGGEVGKVDERSDVFGLGAILTVILTGAPPYAGTDAEAVRVMAIRGDLVACLDRLDGCGAEPELVALCKRCLAFAPADRPRNAGTVAEEIAGLRAAAEERARRAELERVQAEAEKAAAEERALERRRQRRLRLGAAAALVLAALGGLTAVLLVQRRANADLAAKNAELADEQAKVQARFELAQKAIATFHTGVSEDVLLKNKQFEELRTRLLKQAAGFYGELEKLLEGKTDAKSRRLLAEGYFQLGQLTDKIGSKPEALAVHRKALAVRRELAAAADADVETRLDVIRSLRVVGMLLQAIRDMEKAKAVHEEQLDLAAALEAESPTDAVRSVLGLSYNNMGSLLSHMGKRTEALAAYEKARAIRQKLAEANPSITDFQRDLALSHHNIGAVLDLIQKSAEALAYLEKALAIRQKLAEANPSVADFQRDLAHTYYGIGRNLLLTGKLAGALAAYEKALAIRQKLADTNPAVTDFQHELAISYQNLGNLLADTGKLGEALAASEKALAIRKKLAETNPAVSEFQRDLANSYTNLGILLSRAGKPAEALSAFQQVLALYHNRADAVQKDANYQEGLANTYNEVGRLLAKLGRFTEAFASLDKGQALFQKLRMVKPGNVLLTLGLGESHGYRGWALQKAGKPAEAVTELRLAVGLWHGIKPPITETLIDRAWALALLAGLGADAKSGLHADEASDFADKAAAALRDAVNAGWEDLEQLKEPDFDPLRKRQDFQKLMKQLEAKAASARYTSPDRR